MATTHTAGLPRPAITPASVASGVDWARSQRDVLAARSPEAETLRQLPEATVREAEASGFFTIIVPENMGGAGGGLRELAETTRVLAQGCVSSAWTLSFLALHNWMTARCPQELRTDVFGRRGLILAPCPLAPTGTARLVDGGYTVKGRWEWATGVQHADWVIVHAIVDGVEGFESRVCFLPIDDVNVSDVWHTSGMRGTGSNTVAADGVFVPTHRTIPFDQFTGDRPPGVELSDDPMLACRVIPALALVASAAALGGAEAAYELFHERISTRVLAYTLGTKAQEQPAAQIKLAEVKSKVRAARLVWRDAIEQTCCAYEGQTELTVPELAEIRLAAAQTVRLSTEAVVEVLEGAGASVHFESSPVQRISRDLLTLRGHVIFDWDRTAQLAGKIDLGLERGPTDML